jgi:hypothetical protein
MAVFSIGRRTTSGTIAEPAVGLRTTSTKYARLLTHEVFINAATASVFGIGHAAVIGVTPTSPVTLLSNDAGTATTVTAVAWGTKPTVPANFYKRISLPATIGAGVIWNFPRGIMLPVSDEWVTWNITATSVADVNLEVEE